MRLSTNDLSIQLIFLKTYFLHIIQKSILTIWDDLIKREIGDDNKVIARFVREIIVIVMIFYSDVIQRLNVAILY